MDLQSLIKIETEHLSECCLGSKNLKNGFEYCNECGEEIRPFFGDEYPILKKCVGQVNMYKKMFVKNFPNEKIVGIKIMEFFDKTYRTLKDMNLVSKKYPTISKVMYVILWICKRDDLLENLKQPKEVKEIEYILNYSPKDDAYTPHTMDVKTFGSCLSVRNVFNVMEKGEPETSMDKAKKMMTKMKKEGKW